jgi:hypothetical protein
MGRRIGLAQISLNLDNARRDRPRLLAPRKNLAQQRSSYRARIADEELARQKRPASQADAFIAVFR